jgi:DNA-binding transcriptional MerR regulator
VKINEVEALVGITKKNIRFYEEQGLLAPRRNSENGYREYGAGEVARLQQIKLMRKLGVPLDEIRAMLSGSHTVGDGMRRHLVVLEREQRNLEQSVQLCQRLKNREERLDGFDAGALLEEMERLEEGGTTFLNKQQGDAKRRNYVAPVLVALLMTVLMAGAAAFLVWAGVAYPEDRPPMLMLGLLVLLPVMVLVGVYVALYQRLQEIRKGEKEDAKRY